MNATLLSIPTLNALPPTNLALFIIGDDTPCLLTMPPQVGISVAFDYTMRILGPCLIVMALGLIGTVTFMYFRHLLPLVLGPGLGAAHLLHALFALFLLVNVLFNYVLCVLTDPGQPIEPADDISFFSEDGRRIVDRADVDPRTYGFCKKCRIPRPPR